MITKYKIFENIEDTPEVGDYILVYLTDVNSSLTDEQNDYVNSNVGSVLDTDKSSNTLILKVGYDDIEYLWIFPKDIIYLSKTKEDVETYIQMNKYNL